MHTLSQQPQTQRSPQTTPYIFNCTACVSLRTDTATLVYRLYIRKMVLCFSGASKSRAELEQRALLSLHHILTVSLYWSVCVCVAFSESIAKRHRF